MKNKNPKRAVVAISIFAFLLSINFSCSENETDEQPNNANPAKDHLYQSAIQSTSLPEGKLIKEIGEKIPNTTAKGWIDNHQAKFPKGVKYHLFGKNTFDRLLNQSGAAGIRLYNGVDDDGNAVILMVAVDSNNTLLDGATQEGYDDASYNCPPVCGIN